MDLEMGQFLREIGIPFKVVANKIDKLPPKQLEEDLAFLAEKMEIPFTDIFRTSVKFGKGLNEVRDFVMPLFA